MATYRQRSTPGVYITELDAFPRSVVGVQTAVPAFIGYTQFAKLNGKPIYFTPVKISSLADYEVLFGASFEPFYNIEAATDIASGDNYDFACMRENTTPPPDMMMRYYKFTRDDSGQVPPEDREKEIEPITVPTLSSFALYNALRLFYANGGGTCYIVSVGAYFNDSIPPAPVAVEYDKLKKGLDAIREQSGPTMLVIPDAVLLPPDVDTNPPNNANFYKLCVDMLTQCAELQDRVAILDVYGADSIRQTQDGWKLKMDNVIENFHAGVGDKFLNYGMAYFPYLVTTVIQPSEIDYTNFNITDPDQWTLLKGILDDQARLLYPNADQRQKVLDYIEEIPATLALPPAEKSAAITRLNQNLVNAIPLLKEMENDIAVKMSLLPSSPAMAGVYTYTDTARGVWNAPANVTLTSVLKPNVQLNDAQQGELNVPLDGKAIDVIRQFVGRGAVVWGARTLDGNSNDWRYIQVRRTIVYIEQSIKAALQPFVFAANDGRTWVAVTAMVSNFLTGLWTQGGLMGAKPDEAFSVSCGLGSTMTPLDILEGYMIVQVRLQMIRPAEYIELTFKQKMQGIA